MRWQNRSRALVAGLWAGSLCTVGFMVAPLLFRVLPDPVLAGGLAGVMFRAVCWASLVFGVLMVLLSLRVDAAKRRWLIGLSAGVLVFTAINLFGLVPMIAELRAQGGPLGVFHGDGEARFKMLHGWSEAVFMVQSLLALVLVAKNAD